MSIWKYIGKMVKLFFSRNTIPCVVILLCKYPHIFVSSFQGHCDLLSLFITPANKVWGYIKITVCISICLSVYAIMSIFFFMEKHEVSISLRGCFWSEGVYYTVLWVKGHWKKKLIVFVWSILFLCINIGNSYFTQWPDGVSCSWPNAIFASSCSL